MENKMLIKSGWDAHNKSLPLLPNHSRFGCEGLGLADRLRLYLNYIDLNLISIAHFEIKSQNHCRLGLVRIARRVFRTQASRRHGRNQCRQYQSQDPSQDRTGNALYATYHAACPKDCGTNSAHLRGVREGQAKLLFPQGQGDLPTPGGGLNRLEAGKEIGAMG